MSLSNLWKDRRGNCSDEYIYEVSGNRKVVKFKMFLNLSENKRSLLKFLSNYLLEHSGNHLKEQEVLIIAGGFEDRNLCFSVNQDSVISELKHLKSNHDEADTRLILHVLHEYQILHLNRILVKSVDTDVLILLIYYYSEYIKATDLKERFLFMELGHGNKKRVISISEIVQTLGNQICKCLPAMHVLTGCDTTNALFKIGKKTAYEHTSWRS
jgi:hypothetical protein